MPSATREVWIKLHTGQEITGTLVRIDHQGVVYRVLEFVQFVPVEKVASISFASGPPTPRHAVPSVIPTIPTEGLTAAATAPCTPLQSGGALSLPIIYGKVSAKYTERAIETGAQGRVILEVVYPALGKIRQIKVIQGLQDGLNESAIAAAKGLQFSPARRNGNEVDCRGQLIYEFNLSSGTQLHEFAPKGETVFRGPSRRLSLKWPPVPGALKYRLQVEYFVPGNNEPISQRDTEVEELEYTMTFANYLRGRWRISAILANGKTLPPSSWMKFKFEQ